MITIPMRVSASGTSIPMEAEEAQPSLTLRSGSAVAYTGPQGPPGVGIESTVLNPDYTLTITLTDGTAYTTESIRGEQGETGPAGQDGSPGRDGRDGRDGHDGQDGQDGAPGQDGYSPTVQIIEGTGRRTLAITDKNGTHTTTILDGEDGSQGSPGQDGQPGADGYSPSAAVSKSGNTATITVTDKNGTTTASVSDGQNGQNGQDGQPGADGYSPTVSIVDGTGTHTITITDKNGDHTTTVNDGQNGQNGQDGQPGSDGESAYEYAVSAGYTGTEEEFATKMAQAIPGKTSDLVNDSGYITGMYIAAYGKSTYADVLAAYQANKVVYCRASSNNNPATGNQLRMAFLAYVNQEATPTSFEFQYYRSVNQHSASQQGDQVYVYKLDKTAGWTVTVRENYTKIVAGTGLTSSYSNGVLTISLA